MSLPPADYRFESPVVRVLGWTDPVTDLLGHEPRSPYVEQFWLPILGPSTTFLMRMLGARLDEHPDGFDLDLDEGAKVLGLGKKSGPTSPFVRALARTGQFRLSKPSEEGLLVRRRLPALSQTQITRLPPLVRSAHDQWVRNAKAEPSLEQRRIRARRLALSLLELGETEEEAEHQLHRWHIHPAMAHEALRWAQIRRGQRPPAPPTPVLAAADRSGPPPMRRVPPTVNGERPKIGATRPAPVARFDPYDPPDAA